MSDGRFNLTEAMLRQRQLAWFFVLLVAIGGIIAYTQLGQREDPDFAFRYMVIRTQWPGASATQVEREVTDRISKKLQELPYFRRTTSYSRVGESLVILELQETAPPSQVSDLWYQARKKMSDLRLSLPAEVVGPFFNDEFGDVFGTIYAFTGEGFTHAELRDYVERVRQRLYRLPDVSKIDLIGVQPEKITVTLSHARLAELGIGALAIAQAIQAHNIVQDGGALHAGEFSVPLRVSGSITDIAQLAALPLNVNGRILRLGDVAEVKRGYLDPPEILMRYGGRQAIGLAVAMKPRGDVLRLGNDLTREMAALRAELPIGIEFAKVTDQPAIVKVAVEEFMRSFLEAVAIVLVASFIFLGVRAGLVVGVTIPLVIAATFLLMRWLHIDLHRISTGALILSLGLLVDDAIIAVEMMVRKLEEGFDRVSAAAFAYTSTAFPMLTGTLITIAGFLPIATAESTTGEYTFAMFSVVALALLVSWVAAIVVTPLAGFYLLKPHGSGPRDVFDTPFYHRLRRVIEWCITYRKTVIAGTVLLFLLGMGGMALTEKQFFPSSNRLELLVELWLPEGSDIHATERETERLEKTLAGDKDVASYASYVGNGSPRFFLSMEQQLFRPNFAQMMVLTHDLPGRERTLMRLRTVLERDFPGVRARAYRVPLGPPVNYPVQFHVMGSDIATLKHVADQVIAVMRKDRRLVDVHTNWGDLAPVLHVEVDQDRAAAAGVSSADIARALHAATDGLTVSQFRERDQLIDIILRAPESERSRLEQVADINLQTANGHTVPLSQVAQVREALEEPILWRRGRDLTLTVRADVIDGVQAPDVSTAIERQLAPVLAQLPAGYQIEMGGALGESANAQDSINAQIPLMLAVVMAVLMIQLKSFSRTFMVLLTAPLGVIGVALSLLIFQKPFGFVAMLGTIALGGMIMRNTVILVDQIRQDLAEGQPPWVAIRESTVRRFRPIVLTAAAAMLAMIPLTRSLLWGPMAYAIMGGLLFATALTVLFVPAMYAAWFRVKRV